MRDPAARHFIVACLAVAAVAVLACFPALRNSPTYDDKSQLEMFGHPADAQDWFDGIAAPWWPGIERGKDWRPLARLTIQAQTALAGPERVWPLYAFNIALHALVCVLLMAAALRCGISPRAATIAGLVFAAHPIHVEVIHQIVGRTELLAAIWMLGGLILFARTGLGSARVFWQQPLIYLLALGSKEHAILYPFYLLLFALGNGWGRLDRRRRIRLVGLLLLLGSIALYYIALRSAVIGTASRSGLYIPLDNYLYRLNAGDRLAAALGSLGYAAAKIAWPWALAPTYSVFSLPFEKGWGWAAAWLGAGLFLLILASTAAAVFRRSRAALLALAWLAAWGLTSNLLFLIGTSFQWRLWYWPSVPAFAAFGWLADRLLGRIPLLPRRAIAAAAVAAMLALAWNQSAGWRSNKAYAEATLAAFPRNQQALVLAANAAFDAGSYADGAAFAQRAVDALPGHGTGWHWLGLNLSFLPGREAEAEAALRRAIRLFPYGDREAWIRLADLLERQGIHAEARTARAAADAKKR